MPYYNEFIYLIYSNIKKLKKTNITFFLLNIIFCDKYLDDNLIQNWSHLFADLLIYQKLALSANNLGSIYDEIL